MLKSITATVATAREIFRIHPEVKKELWPGPGWGGAFWTTGVPASGYFVNTVSKFGDESTISKYVRDQGLEKDYKILHKNRVYYG